jgi:hypothetical protein
MGSHDQAVAIQNSGMRLVCTNGPGCKNHDWRKHAGAKTHTRISHHHNAVSQPVGGGYQYTVSNKKKAPHCACQNKGACTCVDSKSTDHRHTHHSTGRCSERSHSCSGKGVMSGPRDHHGGGHKAMAVSCNHNLSHLCDQAKSERKY